MPRPSLLSGWGQLAVPGQELRSEDLESITRDVALTRGLGRSYGDSSLPPPSRPVVAATPLADRLLAFDEATGVLRAEAGYSLRDLFREFVPRGWFTPVSPGTQFVTLGGMVAADVHGKNHHVDGTIGRHVVALRLRVASGEIVECSREHEPDLFRATIGGMGLTGHILEVALRLAKIPSSWILGTRRQVPNIDAYLAALKEAAAAWPFTMGWIDCLSGGDSLGRGFLWCGRWATASEAPQSPPPAARRIPVPFSCPSFVMGHRVGTLANEAIYRWNRSKAAHIINPLAFFYPLDALTDWHRLYGHRGFTQHQSVLPERAGPAAVRQLLELLTQHGAASFLCVIKDCGDEGEGLLSFPLRGTSIALDIPVRDNTQSLVDTLNEFVISVGGRIYLAKDAFTRAEHFRAMEPRLDRFLAVRRRWDPEGRLKSAQSVPATRRHPMNVVVLGATKGIGRAVARQLAGRGDRLFLLGRDRTELDRASQDLVLRAGAPAVAGTAACDLSSPESFAPALAAAAQALGQVHTVVVTAADFATQAALEADLVRTRRLLDVNFTNTIVFCEQARTTVLKNGGTLCVVSSVAGDRGRKPVILYGAAKAGLSYYLEGLDHKFHDTGLHVVCVKPGFVKTSMTAGLPPPPFAGEPEGVAADVVSAIDRGTPVAYTPRIWWLVMQVIKRLPRVVMRKIQF